MGQPTALNTLPCGRATGSKQCLMLTRTQIGRSRSGGTKKISRSGGLRYRRYLLIVVVVIVVVVVIAVADI